MTKHMITSSPMLEDMNELYEKYRKYLRKSNGTERYDGFVMFSYIVADNNLFKERWGREARGIVFDSRTGEIVSRPPFKFFNYGEELAPKDGEVIYVGDKIDGSLLQVSAFGDDVFIGSRSSVNPSASYVYSAYHRLPEKTRHLIESVSRENPAYTYVFEIVDPLHQIVLKYDKLDVKFLMARNKKSGEYIIHPPEMSMFEEAYPRVRGGSLSDLLEKAKSATGIEGWVVFVDTGEGVDFIKIKTPWYIERHAILMSMTKPEHFVSAWGEGRMDDLIGYASMLGSNKKRVIGEKVRSRISEFVDKKLKEAKLDEALEIYRKYRKSNEDRKELALTLKDFVDTSDPFGMIVFSSIMSNFGSDVSIIYAKIMDTIKDKANKSSNIRRMLVQEVRPIIEEGLEE